MEHIEYESGMSNCCGARVYSDIGICSDCKEHCDVVAEEEDGLLEAPIGTAFEGRKPVSLLVEDLSPAEVAVKINHIE